ncbi:MAG: hypothetical protein AAGJ11_17435 [Bacteroidota bacterium]
MRKPFLVAVLLVAAAAAPQAQVVDPLPPPLQPDADPLPEEIVAFDQTTPFNEFVQLIQPFFRRAYGKPLIDPTGRTEPIGFTAPGLSVQDALTLVLRAADLTVVEEERFFVVEPIDAALGSSTLRVNALDADLPTAADREIRLDAIIFELNLNRVREIGTNWSSVFGSQQGGEQGGQGAADRLRLFLQTRSVFDAISEVITGPDRIDLAQLNQIFRLFETTGVGQTVSTPSIVVRSGQEGQFQSGADIPITLRDFAGNTVQRFISTGTLVRATPQLIVDQDEIGNTVEFIHLIVDVERSSGRLSGFGVTIDRNRGSTDILLADEEQVVLGGLYSTEESTARSGIPLLKDIPLLGRLFGFTTTTQTEQELIIVLQASLVDPIPERVRRARPRGILDTEREGRGVRLNTTQETLGDDVDPDGN